MKENLLDILMYLFENYMDIEDGFEPDQASLHSDLAAAGFDEQEIDKAFDWLDGLSNLQTSPQESLTTPGNSHRFYSSEESKRIDVECQGFLLTLEQLGILDPTSRELVLDRIMALGSEEVDIDQVKWITMLVLFNQPGKDAAFAWMENLVFQEHMGTLH